MTLENKESIRLFNSYSEILRDLDKRIATMKDLIKDIKDGIELENMSGRLHVMSKLKNNLERILSYEWDGTFEELILDEIKDQEVYLLRMDKKMKTLNDHKEFIEMAESIDECIRYLSALRSMVAGELMDFSL